MNEEEVNGNHRVISMVPHSACRKDNLVFCSTLERQAINAIMMLTPSCVLVLVVSPRMPEAASRAHPAGLQDCRVKIWSRAGTG